MSVCEWICACMFVYIMWEELVAVVGDHTRELAAWGLVKVSLSR